MRDSNAKYAECAFFTINNMYDILFIRHYKQVFDIKYCRMSLLNVDGDGLISTFSLTANARQLPLLPFRCIR